jgi:hypothetical protein
MKRFFLAGLCALSLSLSSCSEGAEWMERLFGEKDIATALQDALVVGSGSAAKELGAQDGYLGNPLVQIALPDTVQTVFTEIAVLQKKFSGIQQVLGAVGLELPIPDVGSYGDSIKVALNRGAEKAAPQSVDVFKTAIQQMTFQTVADTILRGDSTAATVYLKNNTYTGLQTAFAPVLKEPLDLLEPNKYWTPIASKYNAFVQKYNEYKSSTAGKVAIQMAGVSAPEAKWQSLPEDLSGYLSDYATGKALDGLFLMVGQKETAIRKDPVGALKDAGEWISDTAIDLVQEVFSSVKE